MGRTEPGSALRGKSITRRWEQATARELSPSGEGERGTETNGMISTLAKKGNERVIAWKLETEARGADEYFHIKKKKKKALFSEK